MPSAIISDASCLVLLGKIDALSLLREVYGTIITTQLIAAEVRFSLPDWIEIRSTESDEMTNRLALRVDRGEASAIALALEFPKSTVILDDLKARKLARELGLDITGTVGVILRAKESGIIPAILPFIQAIRTTNFRLSNKIEIEVLSLAGEKEA